MPAHGRPREHTPEPSLQPRKSGKRVEEKTAFQLNVTYSWSVGSETKRRIGFIRYYNPVDGRWINRDPIGEQGGLNVFGMLDNDSIVQVDVKGLCSCGIKKGPEYGVQGTVPAGTVLDFTAEFLNDDKGHIPDCCEVRQLINWNKDPFNGRGRQGPAPHPGFDPEHNQPGEWYEDRDEGGGRYGRRTGTKKDTDTRNGYSGNGYHGADTPGGQNPPPLPGFIMSFRLIVVDICNKGVVLYTSKTVNETF